MRTRSLVSAAFLVATLTGLPVIAGPVAGHVSNGTIIVPRLPAGRPVPRLNGSCEPEYRANSNLRTIQYQPGFNFPPATLRVLSTATELFVCVTGLPQRPNNSSSRPYFALIFDVDHDGGTVPDLDDLNLSIDEAGRPTEWHGNGVGFVPQAFGFDWDAVANAGGEVTWTAEFRIALRKIHAVPGAVIGFQARHTSLLHTNDFFAWPSGSQLRQPETWGDLFFLGTPVTVPGPIALDVGRVTQGLEWDVAQGANTNYDIVAGKDLFMSAKLYTLGAITDLTFAACLVQRIGPSAAALQSFPTSEYPRGFITPYPAGHLLADGTFDCWLPGASIDKPGTYQFSMRASMAGGALQTVPVATVDVLPDRPVRLLIYRWIFPLDHPEHRTWDAILNASAVGAMHAMQRVLPVPAGVGGLSLARTPAPGSAGLRFVFNPMVYQCVLQGDETNADLSRCDAETRNGGDLTAQEYNNQAAHLDATDSGHRDRIDLQEIFSATPQSGGGSSCDGGSRSAGSGLDSLPSGISWFIPIQESQHCWGLVQESSPHSMPTNTSHSLNDFFAPAFGLPLMNVESHEAIPNPRGNMSVFFYPGLDEARTLVNEGYEFNAMRRTLLALPSTALLAPMARAGPGPVLADKGDPPPPPKSPGQLQLAFLIDRADHVTLQLSRALPDSLLPDTAPDQSGAYTLVFRDAAANPLGSLPFVVTTQSTHDGPIPITGIVLLAAMPGGTAAIEFDRGTTALFSEPVTAAAPTVSNVAVAAPSPTSLKVTWAASDTDGPALRYSVYLQRHPGEIRHLIATGLTEPHYLLDTSSAPGTPDGVITVQATDGVNTGEGSAGFVTIADKQPIAAIAAPVAGATIIAGQPISLSGTGYDLNAMDVISADGLTWSSDLGGPLGKGMSLMTSLKPGVHVLTLTATAGATKGAASITVTVVADTDGDGMPDSYESTQPCLNAKKADGVGDPDNDGLSSRIERLIGTSPCVADTDKDGWSDGDERNQGSDPRSAKNVPVKPGIFLSSATVNLGTCASPKTGRVTVQTASTSTKWSVETDASFFKASPGRTGGGVLTITADCSGLPQGISMVGHVVVRATGGQARQLRVVLRT